MRRRILVSILSVTAVAIVLFGVPLAIIVTRFVDEDASLRVERTAILASRDVPADFASGLDPVELPTNDDGIVLALYDRQGTLIAGVGPATADSTTMKALDNRVVDDEFSDTRIVAVPVAADERVTGAIRAEQSTAASEARSRRIVKLLGGLALAVLLVAAAIGFVLAGHLSRPVRRLRDAAVQLGDGDFAIDVPRSHVPELDQAAVAMTATARRLDDLVSRERSFSADASHQLRTPLAGLRTAIETEIAFPRTHRADVLHEALSDIDRLERTIADLLAIARTSTIADVPASLSDVLAEIDATWRSQLTELGRTLTIGSARYSPNVKGSAPALRHALDVLVDNAVRHGAGEVRIDHQVAADTVTIIVSDDGSGFTDGAGSPALTVEAASHGLGLPLARRLIEAMPGRLAIVHAHPNTRIEIVLQRVE